MPECSRQGRMRVAVLVLASFAVSDGPGPIARLATRFAIDGDPPISFQRTSALLTFESCT
jgi:hypothetical protein